jgi:hypothetical protein
MISALKPPRPPRQKRIRMKKPRMPQVKMAEGTWSGGDVKQTYTK